MSNNDIMKQLEATREYKAWQESLLAIIGYINNEEDDEELAEELMTDHLYSSLQLQNGLDKAKYQKSKKIHEDMQDEMFGE